MATAHRRALAKELAAHADLVANLLDRPRGTAGDVSILTGVGSARTLSLLVDEALAELVGSAREEGHTWQQIGDVFGTTRQAVYQRFGHDSSE